DRGTAHARPHLARVRLRASIAVVAGRAIRLRGIGARARAGIARAHRVTLIAKIASASFAAEARPYLVRVRLRASIAVVAGRAIRLRRIGARARAGIACAHRVTLIAGRAHDWVAADARPYLARVRLRASIAVVAGRAIRLRRIGARARAGIARAHRVTLIA